MEKNMKYKYPDYNLKYEFTPGTYSENDCGFGETACVDRAFYSLPNESEYAIFKFCKRTMTGQKKCRWEVWHNGRFYNNYFTSFDDAVRNVEGEKGDLFYIIYFTAAISFILGLVVGCM